MEKGSYETSKCLSASPLSFIDNLVNDTESQRSASKFEQVSRQTIFRHRKTALLLRRPIMSEKLAGSGVPAAVAVKRWMKVSAGRLSSALMAHMCSCAAKQLGGGGSPTPSHPSQTRSLGLCVYPPLTLKGCIYHPPPLVLGRRYVRLT